MRYLMETALKHLDFFISHIGETMAYFHEADLTQNQLFAIGLLERLRDASFNLKLTLQNIKQTPELEYSAALTVRSILLDSLIGLSVLKHLVTAEENNATDEEIENIATENSQQYLADGLNITLNYFEQAKSFGLVKEDDVKLLYNNLVKKYSFYFNEHNLDGSRPKVRFKRPPTNFELFKTLAENTDFNELSKIYDAYLFYSKYDHFGILFFEIVRLDINHKLKQLYNCIDIFVKHQAYLFCILKVFSKGDKFIDSRFEISRSYAAQ
jgi:hypothetical protein